MATSPISISLPEPLLAYVEAQIEFGDYGNASELFRHLLIADREHRIATLQNRMVANSMTAPIRFTEHDLQQPDFIEVCRKKLRAVK